MVMIFRRNQVLFLLFMWILPTVYNSSLRGSDTLFQSPWAAGKNMVQTIMQANCPHT